MCMIKRLSTNRGLAITNCLPRNAHVNDAGHCWSVHHEDRALLRGSGDFFPRGFAATGFLVTLSRSWSAASSVSNKPFRPPHC